MQSQISLIFIDILSILVGAGCCLCVSIPQTLGWMVCVNITAMKSKINPCLTFTFWFEIHLEVIRMLSVFLRYLELVSFCPSCTLTGQVCWYFRLFALKSVVLWVLSVEPAYRTYSASGFSLLIDLHRWIFPPFHSILGHQTCALSRLCSPHSSLSGLPALIYCLFGWGAHLELILQGEPSRFSPLALAGMKRH